MGLTEINGLPAHVLLVHAVIVLVPITVLLVLANVFWPGTHQRLGVVTPFVALLTLLLVPLTTHAGEWLRDRVPSTPLVRRHAELGDSLLLWVLALFVVAALSWWLRRRTLAAAAAGSALSRQRPDSAGDPPGTGPPEEQTGPGHRNLSVTHRRTAGSPAGRTRPGAVVRVAVAVVALLASLGALVQVYRVGESGAKAAWHGRFSPTPLPQTYSRD